MEPADLIGLITDPVVLNNIMLVLGALSLALPLLTWIADKTANTWDNRAVALLGQFLSRIPRLKVGLGNTEKTNATVQRASKFPPAMLCVFLLGGCAGSMPEIDPVRNREEANALRAQVNEAATVVNQAGVLIPLLCTLRGEASPECSTARDMYAALGASVDVAHEGIDLLDTLGIGAEQLEPRVRALVDESKEFGATVAQMGAVIGESLRSHTQPAGLLSQPPAEAEGAPGAEGESGARAPAAAAP